MRTAFDRFVADFALRTLTRDGCAVPIQDKPLRLLELLVARPGEVCSRTELIEQLWPRTDFLDFEASLNSVVRRLRRALGDDAASPVHVATVPGYGYRFLGTIRAVDDEVETRLRAVDAETVPPRPHRSGCGRAVPVDDELHWLEPVEQLRWLQARLTGLAHRGAVDEGLELVERLDRLVDRGVGTTCLRVDALLAACRLVAEQGDASRTLRRAESVWELSEAAGHEAASAEASGLAAEAYADLGDRRGIELGREAVARMRQAVGDFHPAVVRVLDRQALSMFHYDDLAAAEEIAGNALRLARRLQGSVFDEVRCRQVLGAVHLRAQRLEDAEREVVGVRRLLHEAPAAAPLLTLRGENHLGLLRALQGRFEEAERHLESGLEQTPTALCVHLEGFLRSCLAFVYWRGGRLEEATSRQEEVLASRVRKDGECSSDVANALHNLAGILRDRGDFESAESLQRQALAQRREIFGEDSLSTAYSWAGLAKLELARRRPAAARGSATRALEIRRRRMPPGSELLVEAEQLLARCSD